MNHFLFVDTAQKQVQLLQSFLDLIGPVNADLLSHVDINLPAAVSMGHQPGAVKLEEDELRTIRILGKNCGRLTTLGLRIQRNNSRFITGTDGDSAQSTREALRQIHAQLQAIPSLVTINARVTIKDLSSAAMDAMQSLGWNVLFD
ncbi:hypothetical protein GMORB2_5049 [Geosmithia morbida]|uniref:Uncharacterized protein n=1 Tax=Geosmithia morbida TaxID=1094350 RepID=A0A9P5D1W7_9HYPO|nr:uncharacterized protein GMORB2_5049 [Geosmithia morbida]KAF4124383.1 hypothetical protein GMORB2_5049 [Geosmithia morbida]